MMLHALVCDAPAKAFVLCTKGHPDFFCCSKCIVKGKHENRVCYPDIRQELRTDQSFRDKAQEEQHAGIPIDLIENVPLDYMQHVCLGVMRKLLALWFREPRQNLWTLVTNEVSEGNFELAEFVPCDFNRRLRSLPELDHSKAAELRFVCCTKGL